MPDSNLVRPGSWFTFSLKINDTQTALQETKQEPGRNIFIFYIIWDTNCLIGTKQEPGRNIFIYYII